MLQSLAIKCPKGKMYDLNETGPITDPSGTPQDRGPLLDGHQTAPVSEIECESV